ncbi:MAG: DUF4825 domain-containing protein [Candidatus Faecousia sp.]|nr:DUF4825 domain-containing protein [Candidatus Faecousia sp.]
MQVTAPPICISFVNIIIQESKKVNMRAVRKLQIFNEHSHRENQNRFYCCPICLTAYFRTTISGCWSCHLSRCRRRSARQGLPFVSILLISGCSKKVETQKADDLSQYKTEYVGDSSNVIHIASGQDYPKGYSYDSIEIQSAAEPSCPGPFPESWKPGCPRPGYNPRRCA